MLHRTSPPIVPRADARPDHGEESLLEFGGPRSARGQAAPASHVAVLVVGQCFSVLRQAGWLDLIVEDCASLQFQESDVIPTRGAVFVPLGVEDHLLGVDVLLRALLLVQIMFSERSAV